MMRRRLSVLAGLVLSLAGVTPAAAQPQPFPARPVKLVVPYTAGGATDILARALAEGMSAKLGQQVIVENLPGANTSVGASAVARAAPDGYTMLVVSGGSVVVNPLLYKSLPYDPERDFRLFAVLTEVPLVLVVNSKVPTRTFAEFVEYARREGERLNFASVGTGNPTHLATELLKRATGTRMTHVPYRGSAPALNDLIGGQVQVMFDVVTSSLPQIRGGTLRALAVGSGERIAQLPDVPSVAESGYPDFRATVWFGLAVPKATPDAIVARLAAASSAVQREPAYRTRLEAVSYVIQPDRDPAAIARFVDEERRRWREIIAAEKISLD